MENLGGDLGDFLSVKKSKLPRFRTDAVYSLSRHVWATDDEAGKAIRVEKITDFARAYLCCEHAPSSISRCRICGGLITRGDIRVGYPIGDPRGNFGVITAWMHLECGNGPAQDIYHTFLDENCSNMPSPITTDIDTDLETRAHTKMPVPKKAPKKPKKVKSEPDKKKGKKSAKSEVSLETTPDDLHTAKEEPDFQTPELETQDMDPTLVTWVQDLNDSERDFLRFLNRYCAAFIGFSRSKRREIFQALSKAKETVTEVSVDDFVKRVLTARHPPPKELTTELLPFQQEGLAWMVNQEQSDARGGILADEMGMGKTVQTIAMILARRVFGSSHPNWDPSKALPDLGDDFAAGDREKDDEEAVQVNENVPEMEGATLVVAPLAAVLQWQGEIERFTHEGTLNVMIYHGHHRKLLMEEMARADVVITTYATIESDFRRIVNRHKIACEYCGQMFLPSKMRFHLTYICGPDAQRTERQALRQRKQEETTDKAMQSLGIQEKSFIPTPGNIIKEVMISAQRWEDAADPSRVSGWVGRRRDPDTPRSSETGRDTQEPPRRRRRFTANDASHEAALSSDGDEPIVSQRRRRSLRKMPDVMSDSCLEETMTGGRDVTEGKTSEGASDPERKAGRLENLDPYMLHKQSVNQLKELVMELFEVDMSHHLKREIIQFIRREGFGIIDDGRARPSSGSRGGSSSETFSEGPASAAGKRQTRKRKLTFSPASWTSDDEPVDCDDDEYEGSGDDSDGSDSVSLYEGPSDGSSPVQSEPPSSDSDIEIFKVKNAPVKKASKKTAKKPAAPSPDASDDDNDSDVSDVLDIEMDLSASPLHNMRWHRIILDEAHRIKSRTTSTAKSIFALPSCGTRWCLTGTPLQNRVGELFSLLRFLRHQPYAYYYCSKRDCGCKSLTYSFKHDRYCSKCGHTKMQHYGYFNKRIAKPIVDYGYAGAGKQALMALKSEVLDEMVLRRTKLERAEDVKLPKLEIFIRREELTQEERDFYEALYMKSKVQFNTYVETGTLLHNFAHIFDLLSRLRQAVDHPYLIIHGSIAAANGTTQASIPSRSRGDADTCGICWEDIDHTDRLTSSCDHAFHRACIQEFIMSAPEGTTLGCPVCYSTLTIDLKAASSGPTSSANSEAASSPDRPAPKKSRGIMSKIKASEFNSSTKIECLVQELNMAFEKDPSSKAIVFSQFTNMLELIEFRLNKEGISCVKLTGSLSMDARHNILTAYNSDADLRVILISLKAGGEGLNLQIANNIFLMDPWWNPAAEMQAIQRAHRIGQTRPVRAVRLIAKNTVEERILQLQEKKQLVFDGTVGSSASAFQKLSSDDLRFLFH